MSYRPQIKSTAAGQTTDLPLDAETIKGKDIFDSNNIIKESFLPQEAEEWEFLLKDGTIVTKLVYIKPTPSSKGGD